MKPKSTIRHLGCAIALLGATGAQAAVTTFCCDAAAKSNYLAAVTALGAAVNTVHEGFDVSPWGPDTLSPDSVKPSVTNQGLIWTPLATTSYLATSLGGGDVHDGTYLMFSVYYDIYGYLQHPSPDGFALTGDGSTLYGVGGWFKGFSGAKVSFVIDGDPARVDFTGSEATLDNTWKFLGFVETAGFNGLEVIEVEEIEGDETNYFWVDDFDIGTTASTANSPPVANNDAYTVDQGAVLTVPARGVLANDTDADDDPLTLTAILDSNPTHASIFTFVGADGSFVYDHDGSNSTSDSFTYQATDGKDVSNIATVDISITPVIQPPPQCTCSGTSNVSIQDCVFYSATITECIGTTAITLGPNVDIEPTAQVVLRSPIVSFHTAVKVLTEGTISIGPIL